jgi:hypothetical protein
MDGVKRTFAHGSRAVTEHGVKRGARRGGRHCWQAAGVVLRLVLAAVCYWGWNS